MEIKIIRKIDELGRVVIPIDVRKHLGLETADSLTVSGLWYFDFLFSIFLSFGISLLNAKKPLIPYRTKGFSDENKKTRNR